MQGLQALDQFKNFVSKIGGLGRFEDTYMVHAAEGETVIPMEVLDRNPILKKRLFKTMMDMGIEPGRYIVGNELNSKNPVTGQPEFFLKYLGRRLRKAAADISGYAAPIAGAMYGPMVGAAVGGALGQYKRENPGDPTQGLNMALRGGAAGIASNLAGGQGIFKGGLSEGGNFGTGFEGFRNMASSPFTSKGRTQLGKFLTDPNDPKGGTNIINNLFGSGKSPSDPSLREAANQVKDGMSIGKAALLYGVSTAALGLLLDQTTSNENVGQQIDPYVPTGEVYQGPLNPKLTFANNPAIRPAMAQGGVMDLQDGGESKGPGTGTSDSIPAMLSDGEFVMTADAVRGAGGGDRREGAKKMYEAMNNLEARA